LVTTAVPLIVRIPSVVPVAAEAGAELAGVLAAAAGVFAVAVLAADDELLLELAHADRARARAASPAAPSILRI
jgi:phosphoribosylcarboxyaminoimidazole (NCAIR) mutase